jgi:hypothetical protein
MAGMRHGFMVHGITWLAWAGQVADIILAFERSIRFGFDRVDSGQEPEFEPDVIAFQPLAHIEFGQPLQFG